MPFKHDSTFVINDVVLDIPPTNIHIAKTNVLRRMQAIRTRSSMKTKSGQAMLSVSLDVTFVSKDDINDKLRRLVAQFSLTPFCYVDNSYLRDSILGEDDAGQNMALALQNLTINTVPGQPGVLNAQLRFLWFNYKPYTPNFHFKNMPFIPLGQKQPGFAFRLFYLPQLQNHQPITFSDSEIQLSQLEFLLAPADDFKDQEEISLDLDLPRLESFRTLLDEFTDITNDLRRSESDAVEQAYEALETFNDIAIDLNTVLAGDPTISPLTSIQGAVDTSARIANLINTELIKTPGSAEKIKQLLAKQRNIIETSAQIYSGRDVWLEFPAIMLDGEKNSSGGLEPSKLYYRVRTLTMGSEQDGLVLEQVAISYENSLSILPMVSHQYPTAQFMGSSDVRFSLSIKALNDDARRAYTSFWNVYNNNILKGRHIPQHFTNIFVSNELFSFVGIRDVVMSGSDETTVQDHPGTYQFVLDLVERGARPETEESIRAIPTSFTNVRKAIWKAIWNNIAVGERPEMAPLGQGESEEAAKLFLEQTTTGFIIPFVTSAITALSRSGNATASRFAFDVGYPTYSRGLFRKPREENSISNPFRNLMLITALSDDEVLGVEGLANTLWVWGVDDSLVTVTDPGVGRIYDGPPVLIDPIDKENTLFQMGIGKARKELQSKRDASINSLGDRYKRIQVAWEGIQVYKDAISRGDQINTLSVKDINGNLVSLDKVLDDAGLTQDFRAEVIATGKAALLSGLQSARGPETGQNSRNNILRRIFGEPIAHLGDWAERADQQDFIEDFLDDLQSELNNMQEYIDTGNEPGDLADIFQHGPLRKWPIRARDIADKVIHSDLIDLKMFKEARELLEAMQQLSAGHVYHDFPMDQIKGAVRQAIGGLYPDDVTLEPDFYFINETADLNMTDFIPDGTVQRAADIATKYAEDVITNGNNWFRETYLKELDPSFREMIKNSSDKQDMASRYTNIKSTASMLQMKSMPPIRQLSSNNITFRKDKGNIQGRSALNWIPPDSPPPKAQHKIETFINALSSVVHVPNTVIASAAEDSDTWILPVEGAAKITSVPGARTLEFGSKYHLGTDIDLVGSERYPVFASAEGEVVGKNFWDGDFPNEGNAVVIRTDYNGDIYFHKYFHLAAFVDDYQVGDIVEKGRLLGFSGKTGTTGVHLHFEVRKGGRQGAPVYPFGTYEPKKIIENIDRPILREPLIPWKGNEVHVTPIPSIEASSQGNVMLEQTVNSLTKTWNRNAGYRMNRAYPGIHISFIEEDNQGPILVFDSFFNYQSILECSVVRDREVAADYCQLVLTNISGVLSNRKFRGSYKEDGAKRKGKEAKRSRNPLHKDTTAETAIDSIMLTEGIKVEIRMGYSDDPEKLTTVLVGRIVSVQFDDNADVVSLEIQSLATELVQDIKAQHKTEILDSSGPGNSAHTGPLLAGLMSSPECVSFGMWKRGERTGNKNRDLLTNRFTWDPEPQTDNIWAPSEEALDAIDARWIIDNTDYRLYQMTIWDVFKEMELRHPEYIASPVPYKEANGSRTRMTMFFGLPDQFYFARDPTLTENARSEGIKNRRGDLAKRIAESGNNGNALAVADLLLGNSALGVRERKEILNELQKSLDFEGLFDGKYASKQDQKGRKINKAIFKVVDSYINSERLKNSLETGAIQPFRKYHLISGDMHIVANNVQVSSSKTFNTVTVGYEGGTKSVLSAVEKTIQSVPVLGDILAPKNPFVEDDGGSRAKIDDLETITMKLDPAIPDEHVRENYFNFPNCMGEPMAKNYCLSLLQKGVWQIYNGELVILGNPDIKPYDICYVFDTYSDMVGPVQVRRVTHHFSHETGFITTIVPDCVAFPSEGTGLTQNQAMALMAETFLKKTFGLDWNIITPGRTPVDGVQTTSFLYELAVIAGKHVNFFGGRRFLFRSQFADPIHIIPMIQGGKPMVAGFGPPHLRKNYFSFVRESLEELKQASNGLGDLVNRAELIWDEGLFFEPQGVMFGGVRKNNRIKVP